MPVAARSEALGRLRSAGRHALELRSVGRRFGALDAVVDVNLNVRVGERRAVLGSNGAGKTTLLNLITGDYPVSSGSISFFGEDVTAYSVSERIRRGLRRTYQISLLFGGLSVWDNVFLACRGVSDSRLSLRRPRPGDPLAEATDRIIEIVHLEDQARVLAGELSHGQQRQLELGLALAGSPRFILFDEPAAGLSAVERAELVDILEALPSHIGYVIIEHDMDVALRVADAVTMMHNGRIFKEGTPAEIAADPEVQRLYLGEQDDG